MTEQNSIEVGNALTIGNPVAKAPAKRKASGKRKAAAKGTQAANKGQQSKAKPATKAKANGSGQQQASGKAEGKTAKGSIPANQIADNAVIKVLVEGNPKKPDTWAHVMFETLRRCDGKTVADYADALCKAEGLPKGYRARPELQLALRREWVRLEQPK